MPGRVKKNRKPQKNQQGSFRIIGGEHRSRRLGFPEVEGLRPTTDRVRETVFNWLQNAISGARVLDLFSGSGALGFEAASRGASEVQFVELNPAAYKSLCQNKELLGVKADIAHEDALGFLQKQVEGSKGFDIIFLDPPFRLGLMAEVLDLLESTDLLAPDALIYMETEAELSSLVVPASWQELKAKKAGQVSYRLFQAAAS